MIDKREIIAKSKEFDIHSSNVQRDYVFGWILTGLYSQTGLGGQLILTGGNSLRKAYFEHARFSQDLDFATTRGLPPDFIGRELNEACNFVQKAAGVTFLTDKTRIEEKRGADSDKKTYEARLYFRDFYGNPEKIIISIRLDVTQFARVHLPAQERYLIHPYSDRDSCNVSLRCLKLEEILAGKLKCLLQRRHSADLYDFVYSVLLNPGIAIDRSQILRTFLEMTIFAPCPGVVKGLLFDLPFQVIRGLWHKFLQYPKQGAMEFDVAVTSFKSTVELPFGQLPARGGDWMFFPSGFRNKIMEAGHSMTLLNIVYNGLPHLVEPYCLAYKTRRDGVSREYLYVWDLTGGRSSQVGIKSFVHPKIQSIENTDQKFDPRFEVELCKAGEPLKSSYFASPPGRSSSSPAQPTSRRQHIPGYFRQTQRYMVRCPYCGKTFKRKNFGTRLNTHKDKYGNACYGRTGYFV